MSSPVPRKLNQSMITALSTAIAKGYYLEPACHLCGISDVQVRTWLKLAAQDAAEGLEEENSIYMRLLTAIKIAEAQAEAKMVDLVVNTAEQKRDGYLGMTFLERRHPDRWGRRERHDINIEQKTLNITRVTIVSPGGTDAIPRQIEAEGSD